MFTMAKGKYLIDNLKLGEKSAGITAVITFSRKILIPFFFASFKDLKLPRKDMHLLVYDNTDDAPLGEALQAELTPLLSEFKSVRLYKSYLKGRGSVVGSGNEQFRNSKLYNIWMMWNRMKKLIYTDTFFLLEDDTICPSDAFSRLYKTLMSSKRIGFVTGIETGRFATPWIPVRLGVHKVKMKGMKVLERRSLKPDTKGIVPIDAAGVYCFAARTAAYLSGFEGYDPASLKIPFFAMDNVLVWNMKQHGWRVLADFNIWCTHLQASAARIIAFGKEQACEMIDLWLPKYHCYAPAFEIKKKNQRSRRFLVTKPAPTWELEPDAPDDLDLSNSQ